MINRKHSITIDAGRGDSEILQSHDMEAPRDMAESCIIPNEVTGKQEWINRATGSADYEDSNMAWEVQAALPLNSFIPWPRVDVGAEKSANVRVKATVQPAIIL